MKNLHLKNPNNLPKVTILIHHWSDSRGGILNQYALGMLDAMGIKDE